VAARPSLLTALAFACCLPHAVAAAAPEAPRTRAVLQSVFEQDGQRYVRLQLDGLPLQKMPFSTFTFRVQEPKLLDGLRVGASVGFRAEHIAGENTVTAIGELPPCVRFQPCH